MTLDVSRRLLAPPRQCDTPRLVLALHPLLRAPAAGGSDVVFGSPPAPWQGLLNDHTAHGAQIRQRCVRKIRAQRVQQPARGGVQQLPERPFFLVPGQQIGAMLGQPFRLDEDDFTLQKLGGHTVANHHQGK